MYSMPSLLLLLAYMLAIFPFTFSADVVGKIASHPACKEDVARLCSSESLSNDLAVLDCLQNRKSDSDADLNTECHSVN